MEPLPLKGFICEALRVKLYSGIPQALNNDADGTLK